MCVLAIFAPLLAPHDPYAQNLMLRLKPPVWDDRGSWTYPLGTDNFGRDLLSRLIYGSRLSIVVGLMAMLVALTFGTTLGLVAGYLGGRAEQVIMRFADGYQAIPEILLAIVVVAVFGGSVAVLILVLGFAGWESYTRVAFNLTRSLRERPFVEAAVASGAGGRYVMWRHILPQMSPVLTVIADLAGRPAHPAGDGAQLPWPRPAAADARPGAISWPRAATGCWWRRGSPISPASPSCCWCWASTCWAMACARRSIRGARTGDEEEEEGEGMQSRSGSCLLQDLPGAERAHRHRAPTSSARNLPTDGELMAEFGVSRHTARSAVEELVSASWCGVFPAAARSCWKAIQPAATGARARWRT